MSYPFLSNAHVLDPGTSQELDTLVTRLRTFLQVSHREDGSLYMSEWISVPFNAANFVGAGGGTWTVDAAAVHMNRYCLINKVLLWHICIALNGGTSMIAGSVSECRFTLPAGLTTYTGYLNINPVAYLADAGGPIAGGIAIGTGTFAAFKKLSGNFSGTVIAVATMMWEVL